MENTKQEIELAINLYKSQNFFKAESLTKKLITNNPKMPFLYNLMGLILSGQGKNDDAIKFYKEGISIQPSYAMIYNNLGTIYKYKKNYIEAESYYKKSIELNNNIAETHNNLGNLYIELNKHDLAIKSFNKSIEINPKFYIAHYNLGILYKSIGNFDDAKKFFNDAVDISPKFYNAHRSLSQVHKYKKNDEHINKMTQLYKESQINENGKIELAFALGKAYEDIKNYNYAFKYFDEGNKLKRNKIKFVLKKETNEFLCIEKNFNIKFLNKFQSISYTDLNTIFIVGMPRSGTTLVEQIISSHSKVYGGGELLLLNNLIKEYFFSDNLISSEKIKICNDEIINKIGRKYIKKVSEISGGSYQFITDKLPINFKWIGFIKLMFPNAKIIHCVRDPKDTCISIYKNFFTNTELNYAYNLDDLVSYYNLYKNIMVFWKNNFPDLIFDVEYEKLVTNPSKEIPKIIEYCGLSWDKKCLKFYDNKRSIKTASDTQVRNKMYSASINTWKNYRLHVNKFFNNF